MASAATAYLANKLLDHTFRNTAYTQPSAVYLGLSTNGSSEISGGAYVRKAVTNGAASGSAMTNSAKVTFTQATASWGTISHAAYFDAESSGNQLTAWTALAVSRTVSLADILEVAIGDADLTA